MQQIILDTDFDTDCDDAGALALLLNLEKQGLCSIQGVICDSPTPDIEYAVARFTTYYGRQDIPIGRFNFPQDQIHHRYKDYIAHRNSIDPKRLYADALARDWREEKKDSLPISDSTTLYRRLLATAEDDSITICAVGLLSAIAALLSSEPDDHSPLSGKELLHQKVAKIVMMAGASFPLATKEPFNWKMDIPSAQQVIAECEKPFVINEWGESIRLGTSFLRFPKEHPLRKSYELYAGKRGTRMSWDLLAVLYSVVGKKDFFEEISGHRVVLEEGGLCYWERDSASRHVYLEQKKSDREIEFLLDELIME